MSRSPIKQLFYITHIDNIPSILERGIFSHEEIKKKGIKSEPIYDSQIVSKRHEKFTSNDRSLWSYANLYFQPRNAMLYRVLFEKSIEEVVIIAVNPDIMGEDGVILTDGNAAAEDTKFFKTDEVRKYLSIIYKDTQKDYWQEADGSKRRLMAECLVPDCIPPENISTIYVANQNIRKQLLNKLPRKDIEIIPVPKTFFQSGISRPITHNLKIVAGDMFFSKMQTMTISVNTVGIMGKGLASRAKYQFPDVYVYYQDLCRAKRLKMGTPHLFKREASLDIQLADEPQTIVNPNAATWFLLFPTKNHWKEDSDLQGIKDGVNWIAENYKELEIKSIGIPALGCGLGRLKWKDIGPVICGSLGMIDIPVEVYLPTEKGEPEEYLDKDFLLGQTRLNL